MVQEIPSSRETARRNVAVFPFTVHEIELDGPQIEVNIISGIFAGSSLKVS